MISSYRSSKGMPQLIYCIENLQAQACAEPCCLAQYSFVVAVEPRHVALKHISKLACLGYLTGHFVSPRRSSPRLGQGAGGLLPRSPSIHSQEKRCAEQNTAMTIIPASATRRVEVEIRAKAGGVGFSPSKSGSRRDGELNLDPPG